MRTRSAIPEREVKRLYAVSGNRCAFTGCDQLLCEPGVAGESGIVTGEMAHIVAASLKGATSGSDSGGPCCVGVFAWRDAWIGGLRCVGQRGRRRFAIDGGPAMCAGSWVFFRPRGVAG